MDVDIKMEIFFWMVPKYEHHKPLNSFYDLMYNHIYTDGGVNSTYQSLFDENKITTFSKYLLLMNKYEPNYVTIGAIIDTNVKGYNTTTKHIHKCGSCVDDNPILA